LLLLQPLFADEHPSNVGVPLH